MKLDFEISRVDLFSSYSMITLDCSVTFGPKIFVSALYLFQLRKDLVIGQFNFSSVFLCFSLVTISRQI